MEFARSISENGWRISANGRMGPGVYFTPVWDVAVNAAKRFTNCANFAVI